jgi:drug/metabolite transporter (DMT)-like permease
VDLIQPGSLAYVLALGSNLCFAAGSLVFAHYSKTISVAWMNCFKACVALSAGLVFVLLVYGTEVHPWVSIWPFLLSGLIGLNLADLFLLKSFAEIGASRSLMLFGFSPLILGVIGRYFFNQDFELFRLLAIFALIGCLLTFSYERYQVQGNWEIRGLINAMLGVFLDAIGTILTRYGFDHAPDIEPLQGHVYRCIGAVLGFVVLARFWPFDFFGRMKRLSKAAWIYLLLGSFAGCFLSLALYLTAVRYGHLASLSAIAVTSPLFAALLEAGIHRRKPSKYLLAAFGMFLVGLWILVLAE